MIVSDKRPRSAQVRALSNASTDLLIARHKELYPEDLTADVVNLTCTMDPAWQRRLLIGAILERELHRTELAQLWGLVCDHDLVPNGPSHGKPLMVLQILEAELGPAPDGR